MVLSLPVPIEIRAEDDVIPGEVEKFVLEVTEAVLMPSSTGVVVEVFVTNSLAVVIVDNDGR